MWHGHRRGTLVPLLPPYFAMIWTGQLFLDFELFADIKFSGPMPCISVKACWSLGLNFWWRKIVSLGGDPTPILRNVDRCDTHYATRPLELWILSCAHRPAGCPKHCLVQRKHYRHPSWSTCFYFIFLKRNDSYFSSFLMFHFTLKIISGTQESKILHCDILKKGGIVSSFFGSILG